MFYYISSFAPSPSLCRRKKIHTHFQVSFESEITVILCWFFLARKNCRNLLVVLKSNYPGHTRALRHPSRCYMLYIVPFLGFVVLTVSIVWSPVPPAFVVIWCILHLTNVQPLAFFLPQNACNLVQFFRKTPFNFFYFCKTGYAVLLMLTVIKLSFTPQTLIESNWLCTFYYSLWCVVHTINRSWFNTNQKKMKYHKNPH